MLERARSIWSANRTLRQFTGYFWVGIAAFVIDAGLLLVLVRFDIHYILANTISFVFANLFNFLAGHYFVFGRKSRYASILYNYLAVLGISAGGLILNDLSLYVNVDFLKIPLFPSKCAATAVVLIWNFGARKRWVYL